MGFPKSRYVLSGADSENLKGIAQSNMLAAYVCNYSRVISQSISEGFPNQAYFHKVHTYRACDYYAISICSILCNVRWVWKNLRWHLDLEADLSVF